MVWRWQDANSMTQVVSQSGTVHRGVEQETECGGSLCNVNILTNRS
jgi:hypothetical protein